MRDLLSKTSHASFVSIFSFSISSIVMFSGSKALADLGNALIENSFENHLTHMFRFNPTSASHKHVCMCTWAYRRAPVPCPGAYPQEWTCVQQARVRRTPPLWRLRPCSNTDLQYYSPMSQPACDERLKPATEAYDKHPPTHSHRTHHVTGRVNADRYPVCRVSEEVQSTFHMAEVIFKECTLLLCFSLCDLHHSEITPLTLCILI